MFKRYFQLIGGVLVGLLMVWLGWTSTEKAPVPLSALHKNCGALVGVRQEGSKTPKVLLRLSSSDTEYVVDNLSPTKAKELRALLPLGDTVAVYTDPDGISYHLMQLEANGQVLISKEDREGESRSSGTLLWIAGFGIAIFVVIRFLRGK